MKMNPSFFLVSLLIFFSHTSRAQVLNSAPELAVIREYSIASQETLTFTASATDADNDVLTFTVNQSSSNKGMSISSSGVFIWTPIDDQVGMHNATIIVSDGEAFDSQTFQIGVSPGNSPRLTAIGDKQVNEDQQLAFSISATDPDSQTLTFTLDPASLVKGMTLSSGQFSWTPDVDMVGEHLVTFIVSDGQFIDLEDIFITVLEIDDPLRLTKNLSLILLQGEGGTITSDLLLVTDEETPAEDIVFTITSAPLKGAFLNGAAAITVNSTFTQAEINANAITYEHDGLPGAADSFSFTVSDGEGGEIGSTVFAISIQYVTAVETPADAGVVAYPMPARDAISIRMENDYRGRVNFRLINTSGQSLIMEGVFKEGFELNHSIDLRESGTGIHFLRITTGGDVRTLKVMKE